MRASSALVLGSFASAAVAANTARALIFPDTVSLAERQAEGDRYECHANCGKSSYSSRYSSRPISPIDLSLPLIMPYPLLTSLPRLRAPGLLRQRLLRR